MNQYENQRSKQYMTGKHFYLKLMACGPLMTDFSYKMAGNNLEIDKIYINRFKPNRNKRNQLELAQK